MRMRLLSFVACIPLQYFSTLSHKQHDFRKKKKETLLNMKCVLISSTTFVSRIQRDVTKMHAGPHVQCRYPAHVLMKLELYRQIFV